MVLLRDLILGLARFRGRRSLRWRRRLLFLGWGNGRGRGGRRRLLRHDQHGLLVRAAGDKRAYQEHEQERHGTKWRHRHALETESSDGIRGCSGDVVVSARGKRK